MNPGYILDKSGMLDNSGIYPGYIWDISGIYPGYIYIPEKSGIYPKYIPECIPNISRIYSQIYLGIQGWGVLALMVTKPSNMDIHSVHTSLPPSSLLPYGETDRMNDHM
jgi:hypothetical protein